MLAIICAMQREAEVIISRLEGKYTAPDGVFSMGRLKGQPVAVAVSAPGKVNAAIAATLMTLETMQHMLKIDTVLNLGVVGGLVEEYRQGDVVLPFAFVQYDIDTTSVGDPPGFVSGVGAERFIASGKIMALKTALTLKLPAAARVYIADLCATADRLAVCVCADSLAHENRNRPSATDGRLRSATWKRVPLLRCAASPVFRSSQSRSCPIP